MNKLMSDTVQYLLAGIIVLGAVIALVRTIVLTMKNQAIDAQTLSSMRKIAALSSRIPLRIAIKNRLR